MVIPSPLSPRSFRQHVVFCLLTSVTAGCAGRWNTLGVQRVFVWFLGGCFVFFCFVFSPYWDSPSRLSSPCRKQPNSLCCAGCVIHVTVGSSFGLRKAKLYKAKMTQSLCLVTFTVWFTQGPVSPAGFCIYCTGISASVVVKTTLLSWSS